jgi:intracellular septation protein
MRQLLKSTAEFGPLLIFVYFLYRVDMQTAIVSLMITAPIGVAVAWIIERKVPYMLLFGAVLVIGFGGAANYFDNENIFKIKPTVAYVLFAAVLGGGLAFGKNFVKSILGSALDLEDKGWKILAISWCCFFLTMAMLNEFVWRNFSAKFWGTFKAVGFTSLTLLFFLCLLPVVLKFRKPEENEQSEN